MLEGGVKVGLLLQLHHRVKMLVVDVSVNPEETLQDGFGHRHEVLWKGNSCDTEGDRQMSTVGLDSVALNVMIYIICIIIKP